MDWGGGGVYSPACHQLPGTHMAGGASPAAGVGLCVRTLHTHPRGGLLHRGSGVLGEQVSGTCQ